MERNVVLAFGAGAFSMGLMSSWIIRLLDRNIKERIKLQEFLQNEIAFLMRNVHPDILEDLNTRFEFFALTNDIKIPQD